MGLKFAAVFVNRDDRDHYTVFRKMSAITNDDFFNFLERAGIDEHPSGCYRIAPISALFREFEAMTVFRQDDLAVHHAELMRKRGVAKQVAILAVHRNE